MKADWKKVREVLDKALDLPSDKREAFVDDACEESELKRQILSVLHAYESTTDQYPPDSRGESSDAQDTYGPGAEIGPYRLEEEVGAGGMGAVFLARRSDDSFDKRVAVKLIKRQWASDEEVTRFRRERQILANLAHPAIAQLLDGGNTPQGHPYLVMEYVEGEPIDKYLRKHSLDLDQKLDIFLQVCSAVQFAHQNLIVHRDLKPGNILVGAAGGVKLLDFGIAKILDPSDFALTVLETRPGSSPMTLAYASPEQIRGEVITTATDVYALGILLYEMLVGRKPYSFDSLDLSAVVDAICKREVTAPSVDIRKTEETGAATPWRKVQGDLDAIVLKALAKEPARRYPSAEQLANDLERFRRSEPVRARRGTLAYRAKKFLYRQRLALSAAVVVLAVLLTSIGVLLQQQERLIHQRNRAELVSRWMVDLFEVPDPGRSQGEKITARELIDKSRDSIRIELRDEPDLLREMLTVLGQTYLNLGLYTEAEDVTRSAIDLTDTDSPAEIVVDLTATLSEIAFRQGQFLESYALASDAVARADALGSDARALARGLALQGYAASQLMRLDEGESVSARAEQVARDSGDPEVLSDVLSKHAEVRATREEFEHAERLLNEALELLSRERSPTHPSVLALKERLVAIRAATLEPGAAIAEVEKIVQQNIKLYGESSPFVALSYSLLADLMLGQGRFEESERYFQKALATGEASWGPSHPHLVRFLNNYGHMEAVRGNRAGAAERFEQALLMAETEVGKESLLYGNALRELGLLDMYRGDWQSAETRYVASLEILEKAAGPSHSATVKALNCLGDLKLRQGNLEEANQWFHKAVSQGRRCAHRFDGLTSMIYNLARNEASLGRHDGAIELLREIQETDGEGSLLGIKAQYYIGKYRLQMEHWAEAEQDIRKAIELWGTVDGNIGMWQVNSRHLLALALLGQGQAAQAVELLTDVVAQRKAAGADAAKTAEIEEDLQRARLVLEADDQGPSVTGDQGP